MIIFKIWINLSDIDQGIHKHAIEKIGVCSVFEKVIKQKGKKG